MKKILLTVTALVFGTAVLALFAPRNIFRVGEYDVHGSDTEFGTDVAYADAPFVEPEPPPPTGGDGGGDGGGGGGEGGGGEGGGGEGGDCP